MSYQIQRGNAIPRTDKCISEISFTKQADIVAEFHALGLDQFINHSTKTFIHTLDQFIAKHSLETVTKYENKFTGFFLKLNTSYDSKRKKILLQNLASVISRRQEYLEERTQNLYKEIDVHIASIKSIDNKGIYCSALQTVLTQKVRQEDVDVFSCLETVDHRGRRIDILKSNKDLCDNYIHNYDNKGLRDHELNEMCPLMKDVRALYVKLQELENVRQEYRTFKEYFDYITPLITLSTHGMKTANLSQDKHSNNGDNDYQIYFSGLPNKDKGELAKAIDLLLNKPTVYNLLADEKKLLHDKFNGIIEKDEEMKKYKENINHLNIVFNNVNNIVIANKRKTFGADDLVPELIKYIKELERNDRTKLEKCVEFFNFDSKSEEAISHFDLLEAKDQYIVTTFILALTTIQNELLANNQTDRALNSSSYIMLTA